MKNLINIISMICLSLLASCKGEDIIVSNTAEVVKGTYDCSTTINDLTFKENAEVQISPSAKGILNKVDLNINFVSTNNKVDYSDVSLKKNSLDNSYLLSLIDANGSLEGAIKDRNLTFKISSKSTSITFTGKKR